MPMENNKVVVNNGYLRKQPSHAAKNNGHGSNEADTGDISTDTMHSRIKNEDNAGILDGVSVVSPLLGSSKISDETSVPQQHTKLPTVVYLGTNSGGGCGVGSGATTVGTVGTSLQRNVPAQYLMPTSHSPQTSQQSEWLLKEPTLRCRLMVLAVALTVLGAAIGALVIYFAGSDYRCHATAFDSGRSIHNNINSSGSGSSSSKHSGTTAGKKLLLFYFFCAFCQ